MNFDFIKIYCKPLEYKREYLITIELKKIKYFIEFKTGSIDSKLIIGSFDDPLIVYSTFFYTSKLSRGARIEEDMEYYTINRYVNSIDGLLRVLKVIIHKLKATDRLSNIIRGDLLSNLNCSGFQVDNKRYKLEYYWDKNTSSLVYNIVEITDKKK